MINKIFNWTFGSVFRTFGRIIAYLLIVLLLSLILSKNDIKISNLFPIMKVSAKTINTSNKQYRWRMLNGENLEYSWSKNWVNMGTETNTTSDFVMIDAFMSKFVNDDNFNSTTDYLAHIHIKTSNPTIGNSTMRDIKCHGSVSGSSWTPKEDYISSCELTNIVIGSDYTDYQVHFKPNRNIEGFQTSLYLTGNLHYDNINILKSSYIETITNISDITNNQTNTIVTNNDKNTESIINNVNDSANKLNDSINNQLGNKCENLINDNNLIIGHYNGSSSINRIYLKQDIYLESGQYYFKTNLSSDKQYNLIVATSSFPTTSTKIYESGWKTSTGVTSFTISQSGYFTIMLRNSDDSDVNLDIFKSFNYMLSNVNKSYCEYGSFTSKLDDTNNAINDIKDTLTDDKLNDSDIEDSLNYNITENSYGPFATFLNLPLIWVQNILGGNKVCNKIDLPLPYLDNKVLTLPCMGPFWDSLGALSTLVQACWLCVVGVRIFNGLFLLVVETTSSKDNDDELTKIKSWEL